MSACLAQAEEGDDQPALPFARLAGSGGGLPRGSHAEGAVFVRVHQRVGSGEPGKQNCFEVRTSPEDGRAEIPLAVWATTVGSWLPGDVLRRSPWLSRCLDAPIGATTVRPLSGAGSEEGSDFVDDFDDPLEETPAAGATTSRHCGAEVACRRVDRDALELGLPGRGAGRLLLTAPGLMECLELASARATTQTLQASPARRLLTVLLWAFVLELPQLAELCREVLPAAVDVGSLALALACGHATGDLGLLRLCYWRLREALLGAGGGAQSWLEGKGPVRLIRGCLAFGEASRIPLAVLRPVLEDDLESKRRRWLVPVDGYMLCQVHRERGPSGAYPHRYEIRLDHSNELLISALREDEQAPCRLFVGGAAEPNASEHCQEFLGSVVPNFWGTSFELRDSGSDMEGAPQKAAVAAGLPLRKRQCLCKVGYETNILGDCPRKVTVDFDRGTTHHHMENVAPRWDKKLNSYALPFFGRVKKASAKNFQLVVDDDINTIFLMFGKISKDVFCLDFRGPLTPMDAAAIALAALAKKRAVS